MNEPGQFFAAITEQGVRHAVWKDVAEALAFCERGGELDLLVAPADRSTFTRLARTHDFAEYRNLVDLYGGHVAHYLRFSARGHHHLHVYDSLLTGDHVAKEYCLDPLFGDELYQGPVYGGVKVVRPEDELLIGILRVIAKAGRVHGMRPGELARLRSLWTPERLEGALAALGGKVTFDADERAIVRRIFEGSPPGTSELAPLRSKLVPLRRFSRARTEVVRTLARVARAAGTLLGFGNKVLTRPAPALAIVGVDGSGKSTLARRLHALLGAVTSARYVYLGGNQETHGVATRVARRLWQAGWFLRRIAPEHATARDLATVIEALFEYCKHRDRVARMRRARRLQRRGAIVVYERYPIRGLFDYPYLAYALRRGDLVLGVHARRLVEEIIGRIDAGLALFPPPEVLVLIDMPLDAIAARRSLDPAEERDVRMKLDLVERFPAARPDVRLERLSNQGSIETSLERLCVLLNRELCSSSS